MVLRDLRPGVALFHGVGDFLVLGAVKELRQIPQVHDLLRGVVALLDLHLLPEVAGDGVLAADAVLELLLQLLQRALIGGGADELAVHIEAVAVGHEADLVGELLLQGALIHQLAAGQDGGGVADHALGDGIGPAEGLAGAALQVAGGVPGHPGGADLGQLLAVVAHHGAQGEEGEEAHHQDQRRGAAQEPEGVGPPVLHGTAAGRPGDAAAAAEELPLPEMAPQHGQHPAEEEQDLHRQTVGLREAAGLLLPPDAVQAAADMGHPLRDAAGEGRRGLLPGALLHHRGVDHGAAALFPGGLPPQPGGAGPGGSGFRPGRLRFRGLGGFGPDGRGGFRLGGRGPDGLCGLGPGVGRGVLCGQGLRPAAGPLRLHGPLAAASCQAPLRVPALQALAQGHGLVFLHRRVHGPLLYPRESGRPPSRASLGCAPASRGGGISPNKHIVPQGDEKVTFCYRLS